MFLNASLKHLEMAFVLIPRLIVHRALHFLILDILKRRITSALQLIKSIHSGN